MQVWKEAVALVRMAQAMVAQCDAPEPGSDLEGDDASCPPPALLSDAARGTLYAALDNLALWCDSVSPKVYVEGVVQTSAPRPHFTLARAGMECAAQVGWILSPEESATRVERHLRLVAGDVEEERKAASKLSDEAAVRVTQRIATLKESLGEVKPPPAYLDMVRAVVGNIDESADRAEVLWRTASAAAHGKLWFVGATHTTRTVARTVDGRVRAEHRANPDAVTAVVALAAALAHWAARLYIERIGLDVNEIATAAFKQVMADLPRSVPDSLRT